MSILSSELRGYYPLTISDAASNGGRISFNRITSGALQNVFPHIFRAERLAGSTKHRKIFLRVDNDADLTLYGASVRFHGPTPGDDYVYFHVGTQRDTQTNITGSERKYGSSLLKTTVTAGATTLVLTVEHTSLTGIFQNGDSIRISDKLTPTSVSGNEEEVVIDGAPGVSGDEVTVTLATALINGYDAGAYVSSVYLPSVDVAGTVDNWVESGSGTYDESGYPVLPDNIGTMEQTWTLTFSDATNFSVVGDTLGSVGAGNTSTNYIPNNPSVSKPYFTLEAAGWGGTWTAGNTIVFQTHPPAVAVWETRVVPVSASSMAGNGVTVVFEGETV